MMKENDKPIWVQALLDRSLSPAAYRVFAYLFWRQGSNKVSWPSQDVIAEDVGLTVRAVKNLTKKLEKRGYIRIARPNGQGRGHSLQYAIFAQRKGGTESPPYETNKGGTESPPLRAKRGNEKTKKGGTKRPPNTFIEHKEVVLTHSLPKTVGEGGHLLDVRLKDFSSPKVKPAKGKKSGKRQAFIPPTIEQVREYAESIDYFSLNAEHFVNFYETRGWMVGRCKMKNWKAAVRTWKCRDKADGKRTGKPARTDPNWLPTEKEAEQILGESRKHIEKFL